LDEIRLEEIHEEQAAYWKNVEGGPIIWGEPPETSPIDRFASRKVQSSGTIKVPKLADELDFKVLTLEEIRRNRQLRKQEEEREVSSTPTSTSKPSILNRLGYNGVRRSRQVSSTSDVRRSIKRVHSPDFDDHGLKRGNLDEEY